MRPTKFDNFTQYNFRLEKDLKEDMEKAAHINFMSTSEFVREAIEEKIQRTYEDK